jgi:vitamin B12 transporter
MHRSSFVLAAVLAPVFAQAASLSGIVTASDGQPLRQVPLILSGASLTRSLVTTAGGRYEIAELAPGTYHVESGLRGLVVTPAADVRMEEHDVKLDLTLAPAPLREHVVVAAARGEAPSSTLGTTVTSLDQDRIEARAATSLTQLLLEVPGVAINRSGPVGRQATVFLRGGSSSHTRVLVDGIPVNEPGGYFDYGAQLGLDLQQVEVVRGAASSLYGSDALAGVIALQTRRPLPGEPTRMTLAAEGGSFAFQRYQAGASGHSGRLDWSASGARLLTDNEGPNSTFRESAGAVSVGADLGHSWSLQLTGRGGDSFHGTPGQTGLGELDADAYFERTDFVTGLRLRGSSGGLRHELRGGIARSNQLSVDPSDSGGYLPRYLGRVASFPVSDYPNPTGYQNDTGRGVLGYQVEYGLGTHLVTGGVDAERESGDLGTRGEEILSPSRTNIGLYLQDRWAVTSSVFLTAGGRVEHNDSFGTAVVPRGAVSWILRSAGRNSTRLKASAGAGIKEPGFFESFGTSFYAQGNPDLKAERSHTYDGGIEQRGLDGRVRVELTAYRHDYRDQIAYTLADPATYRGTYVNLGQAKAQGVELELEAQPRPGIRVFGQYTYTDSTVVVSTSDFDPLLAAGKPLLRRPKNAGSLTVEGGPANGRFTAAATLVAVGARPDSDFAGLGLESNDAYTRVDARLRSRVSRRLELLAVAENLFDADYHEVLGYPALGRALRFGVRVNAGH